MTPAGFWYLSTPYSKYGGGLDAAHRVACKQAAVCIKAGISVYSPIGHTHCIAMLGNIDPLDHNIWLPADEPLMNAACGIIVVMMPGWKESFGMAHEIALVARAGKPIVYMTPDVAPIEGVMSA